MRRGKVSAYDLANTYFPAWEAVVQQGGAKGVMCRFVLLYSYQIAPFNYDTDYSLI